MKKKSILSIIVFCFVMFFSLGLFACVETQPRPEVDVNFFVNGEIVETTKTNGTMPIQQPASPTKEGYEFFGWYLDEGTWNEQFTSFSFMGQILTENINIYARFIKGDEKNKTFTVTFDSMGGNAVDSQTISFDGTVREPRTPVKAGYEFEGWYADQNFTRQWDFNRFRISQDTTIYAKWFNISDLIHFTDFELKKEEGDSYAYYYLAVPNATTSLDLNEKISSNYKWTVDGGENKTVRLQEGENHFWVYVYGNNIQRSFSINIKRRRRFNVYYYFEGSMSPAMQVEEDTILPAPTQNPGSQNEDYEFIGWYVDSYSDTKFDFTKPITQDTYIYARFARSNYRINYILNGGENHSENPSSYNKQSNTIILKPATKEGYTFDGWFEDYDFTQPITQIEKGRTGDIWLYAKFIPTNYQITYELFGGTNHTDNPATYTIESATITLQPATKEGYEFDGWYIEYSQGDVREIQTIYPYAMKRDITLYARFAPIRYYIQYENCDSWGNNPYYYNLESEIITLVEGVKYGYEFEGWFEDSALTQEITQINCERKENIVLYAKFSLKDYSITYHLNGGTNHTDNPTTYTIESATITLQPATKEGYTFVGWYTDSAYRYQTSSIRKRSYGDLDIYAKFSVTEYTITYNLDGGTNSANNPSKYSIENETITLQNATKAGYTFEGWYTDSAYTQAITQIIVGNKINLVLYAKFTIIEYTITYNLNGGINSANNPEKYTVNSETIYLRSASKQGYTFNGWYRESDYTNSIYQINKGNYGDLEIYAKFTAFAYTITYNLDGGTNSVNNPTKYSIETETITLQDATKTGYTFEGWYTDSSFANRITQITKGSFDYLTLYAKFTAIVYTITYNLDGGTNNNPATYTITSSKIDLNNPTKSGYVFKGWFTDATFTTRIYEIDPRNLVNYVLYAKWQEESLDYFTFNKETGAITGTTDIAKYRRYITIPDKILNVNVTSLAPSLFKDFSNLSEVTIGNNVTSIGEKTFYNCGQLEKVIIGNSVTSISPYMFYSCERLTSVTISNSVKSIGEYAFYNCWRLSGITIPEGVTSIGNNAFTSCSKFTSITIPNSVTTIGGYAFSYCGGLTTINWNAKNVKTTNGGIFENAGCATGAEIIFGENVTNIPGNLFVVSQNGTLKIKSVTIPNSVTTIGGYAFYNCPSNMFNRVNISSLASWCNISFANAYSNPLYIAKNLYIDNTQITTLTIPSSITTLKQYAFAGFDILTEVTIPSTVDTMESSVFYQCSGLVKITLPFVGNKKEGATNTYFSYIFNGATESFYNRALSSLKEVIITGGTTIPSNAFNGCLYITNITIPNSVKTIEEVAFRGCKKLVSITMNGVTTIGQYAFDDCGFTSLIIPNSVTTIGASAFYRCENLESLTLPFVGNTKDGTGNTGFNYIFGGHEEDVPTSLKNVTITGGTSIPDGAFSHCSNITTIIVNGVTNIGGYAFNSCSDLDNVTIGTGVTTIGEKAFYNCSNLTSITIGEDVTSIGEGAFTNCGSLNKVNTTNLEKWCGITFANAYANPIYISHNLYVNDVKKTELAIPNSVTTLKDYAFVGYTDLTNLTLNSVVNIGEYAFANCSGLTSLTITDSVKVIGANAFANCSVLASIEFGNGITTIGEKAFYRCSNLTSLIIPNSVTTIGFSAFEDCLNVASITIPFVGNIKNGTKNTEFGYIFGSDSWDKNKKVPTLLETVTINGGANIPEGSFINCSNITTMIVNGVTNIGQNSLSGCSKLANLTIGTGVTEITAGAIPNNLTSLTVTSGNSKYHSNNNCLIETTAKILVVGNNNGFIPSNGSVTSIGDSAFAGCSFETITIPSGIISIGNGAFCRCTKLYRINIPSSVTTIGDYAFSYCNSLYDVTLNEGLKVIGSNAFSEQRLIMSSISIPDSVETIKDHAFYARSLDYVKIGSGVKTIGASAFQTSIEYTVDIRDLTSWFNIDFEDFLANPIGSSAVRTYVRVYNPDTKRYDLLDNLVIPAGITAIKDYAFGDCYNLKSITIPDSVTSLGKGLFQSCGKLESINIGSGITNFPEYTFSNSLGKVSSIIVADDNPTYTSKDASGNQCNAIIRKSDNTLLFGCKTTIIPESVTSIANYAFAGCKELTSIIIPNNVTSIGVSAFSECRELTSIIIPESVTSIEGWAFWSCIKLESIVISNNRTSLIARAFEQCYALKTIYFKGTQEEWNNNTVLSSDSDLGNSKKVKWFYLETAPELNEDNTAYVGNYWHYNNGVPEKWVYSAVETGV